MKRLPRRQEVPVAYTWNLETIYPSDAAWAQDFARLEALLPQLAACQGTLGQGPDRLLACLRLRDEAGVLMGKLYAYAHLRHDEDTTNAAYQALNERAVSLYTRVRGAEAFIEPEILALPAGTLEGYLTAEPDLQVYGHYLHDLLRQQEHVRSAEVETLLAQAGELARAPREIFTMLNNADIKFPTIRDAEGNEVEVTKGRYSQFLESPDRRVRQDAFTALYGTYRQHLHTIAATLAASVKKDVFYARARNYPSALAAALSEHNIPLAVYHNLIATVNRNLPVLHRYLRLRKRILGLEELHPYDLYTPLVREVDRRVPYGEATDLVLAAVAPLGADYQGVVREALTNRWIDVYESVGKVAGAYSGGAYATLPFILLNYEETLNSVFTLAHELGHSLHSYYTRRHQPHVYGYYTIFVAEVASTLNEALLTHHLLGQSTDESMRLFIINHNLEGIRTTLYRQTLFAEFELLIHEMVERGEALTAEALSRVYYDLNVKYYGAEVTLDRDIELEWARIPHFYNAFYVYQYATGISAATALAQQVLHEGTPAVARYLDFLRSGSSVYSIDLLRRAGVDMASPAPVQQALDVFGSLVEQMEQVTGTPGNGEREV